MQRVWLLTVVFSGLLLTCASADIYRCRMPDGRLVMTDQEAEMPADCQPFEGPAAGVGSFNVIPAIKETVESPPAEREVTTGAAAATPSPWQDQATTLVQSYKEAVKKRYRASLMVEKRHAIKEIVKLKEQKQQMLGDLAGSGLMRDDQQAIRKILDQIPQ